MHRAAARRARRLYPITTWLVVIAAIVVVSNMYLPPVALGTAVYAAYSAITHSRYRNLAIAMVTVITVIAAVGLGNDLPRFPGRLTAVFAILPAAVAASASVSCAAGSPTPPPGCAAPPPMPRRRRSARSRPNGRGSRRSCTTSSRTTYRS